METKVEECVPKQNKKRSCAVAECALTLADGVSMHAFPSDKKMQRVWINFVKTLMISYRVTCVQTVAVPMTNILDSHCVSTSLLLV
jgi:hypothetical protein